MTKTLITLFTGAPKKYSFLEMVSAINRLTAKDIELLCSVTIVTDGPLKEQYEDFYKLVTKTLTRWCNIPFAVVRSEVSSEDQPMPWMVITRNRQTARNIFVDADYDQMLVLGGDNPPPSNAVERLMALDADIAFGAAYQRPSQSMVGKEPYPLVWVPVWTSESVFKQFPDLEAENRFQIERMFRQHAFLRPLYTVEGWEKMTLVKDALGGDGNSLYRRGVLDEVGWTYPVNVGFSEDIHFMVEAMVKGYSTCCDLGYHVAHLDMDGTVY